VTEADIKRQLEVWSAGRLSPDSTTC
jgi:hypothetical protein